MTLDIRNNTSDDFLESYVRSLKSKKDKVWFGKKLVSLKGGRAFSFFLDSY